MIQVTRYDPGTGRIVGTFGCSSPELFEFNMGGDTNYVDGFQDDAVAYVDITASPPVVIARPTQDTQLTGTALTGLPIPCELRVGGETFTVEDGEADLAIAMPGTYPITVTAWPYQDWRGEVTV